MIKKCVRIILLLICLVVTMLGIRSTHSVSEIRNSDALRILVAYNPIYLKQANHIMAAYVSVLEEEGVAFNKIAQHKLLALDPESLAETVPAVIFPDELCKYMPDAFESWIQNYLLAGGSIAAIYDTAVKDIHDNYLSSSFIKKFSGFNHVRYTQLSGSAYGMGALQFQDRQAAKTCQIPYGKLDPSLFLSGYGYGRLKYPFARNASYETNDGHSEPVVLGKAVVGPSEAYPAIVTRAFGKGHVLYVNLPLGHLKAHADDLPLRSMLRFFLLETVKIPHMMNVPFGKGGIVFNWHHDSNADWPYLEQMKNSGFFRDALKYSMHITAGDATNSPGDGLGFDACGKGKIFTQMLESFGTIGSHGGMHHNWFADNVASGAFSEKDIKKYIHQNNTCIASVTDYKVSEYSAPMGVHPPVEMARILPELGIVSYYYTGDSGAAPNRSFFKGRMVSDRTIAFPVMPFIDKASLFELYTAKTYSSEILRWLQQSVDYAIENRTVRLLYSHPYDLYEVPATQKYREAFLSFLDYMEEAQRDGRLTVRPMSEFARFMLQMLETKCRYFIHPKGVDVHVEKAAGLEGLTIAFPKNRYHSPQGENIEVQTAKDAYYAILGTASDETRFFVPAR